jgi:nucleoside-triphosphatase THEP1
MAGLNLLITGRPGAGKTTLVMNVVERLRGSMRLAGFTTAEVRDPSGERMGFQILTVEGKQAELACVGFRVQCRWAGMASIWRHSSVSRFQNWLAATRTSL